MGTSNKSEFVQNNRVTVLTAAVLSTLSAAGLTNAAVIVSNTEPRLAASSIGYIGPVPVKSASVATGNVFDIAVVGFNITGDEADGFTVNDASYLVGPFAPTFGTTQTDTNATVDGETATITSSETVSGTKTTDKVTLSVPTHFAPVGTTFTDGDVIDEEDLEIGFDAGATPLTFSVPVTTTITATGTAVYRTSTKRTTTYTFAAGAVYTVLDPTDTMLSADEGLETLNTSATPYTAVDITPYNFSSFSFSFSYQTPAVPEPGVAMVGLIAGASLLRRRSRVTGSPLVDLSSGTIDDSACTPPGRLGASLTSSGDGQTVGEEKPI